LAKKDGDDDFAVTVSEDPNEIPKTTQVTIKIYNFMGQEIRTLVDEEKPLGHFEITWDGNNFHGTQVASGIYVYEMRTSDFVAREKLILLR